MKYRQKKVGFNSEDVLNLTKRTKKVQKFLKKIEKKGRKYKRRQKRILRQVKRSHRKTYWLVSIEIVCILLTNVIQIVFIKNRIINKNI